MKTTSFYALTAAVLLSAAAPASAVILSGGAGVLTNVAPMPVAMASEGVALSAGAAMVTDSFAANRHPAWGGTFTRTGGNPGRSGMTGTGQFDFTGLAGGFLPAGTWVMLHDLDFGSFANETVTLRAYDTSGSAVTSHWLTNTEYVLDIVTQSNLTVIATDMPGWTFNSTSGDYVFSGAAVAGNPVVNLWVKTTQDIKLVDYAKPTAPNALRWLAPVVPEPSSSFLVLGAAGLLLRRRARGQVA